MAVLDANLHAGPYWAARMGLLRMRAGEVESWDTGDPGTPERLFVEALLRLAGATAEETRRILESNSARVVYPPPRPA